LGTRYPPTGTRRRPGVPQGHRSVRDGRYRAAHDGCASRTRDMSDRPLQVGSRLVIPAGELRWRFDTPGGPGGQHANRSATRAELTFDLGASTSVPDDLRHRMLEHLGNRARSGVVTVSVDESRSQWRNRQMARRRMAEILGGALHEPRTRRPTRPTAGVRRRRLATKRHRAEKKRLRKKPDIDEF
jgi:ribosome-associated protein